MSTDALRKTSWSVFGAVPRAAKRLPRRWLAFLLLTLMPLSLGASCGAQPNMLVPGTTGNFLDFPWPNDIRRKSDGTLDVDGFPGSSIAVFNDAVMRGANATRAFGNNSAVFFTMSGNILTTSFPTPQQSRDDSRSSVMLVNLDNPAAPRVPVKVAFKATGTTLRPERLLSILPYPAFLWRKGLAMPSSCSMV
jgi:hypothetical protein